MAKGQEPRRFLLTLLERRAPRRTAGAQERVALPKNMPGPASPGTSGVDLPRDKALIPSGLLAPLSQRAQARAA